MAGRPETVLEGNSLGPILHQRHREVPSVPPHSLPASSSAANLMTRLQTVHSRCPSQLGAVQQKNLCSPSLAVPPEWGRGPAGSLPGSSDLGLTSPRMGPFANAQLVFIAFQKNTHRNIALPFRLYERLFW